MRQREILGLQWGDINWNGKFLEIRRASWNRIVTTPKNVKSRRVDMPDQLAQVLSEHRLTLTKSALKKGRPMSEWVFPANVGAPLEPNRVREAFFLALKHAGLRLIRFHDLRHSFASWLIGNGESPACVKEQLGHHSIQTTVDTYGHLVPGANRKAVNALDDPGWNYDLFQPPDLIEQSPDRHRPGPFPQREQVLAGVDYMQAIEAEIR